MRPRFDDAIFFYRQHIPTQGEVPQEPPHDVWQEQRLLGDSIPDRTTAPPS